METSSRLLRGYEAGLVIGAGDEREALTPFDGLDGAGAALVPYFKRSVGEEYDLFFHLAADVVLGVTGTTAAGWVRRHWVHLLYGGGCGIWDVTR